MIAYNSSPTKSIDIKDKQVFSFQKNVSNIDSKTVDSFGFEWEKFHKFSKEEIEFIGNEYFDIIDFSEINETSVALDVGCGSGRWSKYLASKVKFIEAIDPSESIFAAAKILDDVDNVRITQASVDNIPFPDESFDLVFSLGVLHHIPDTFKAMESAVKKVKKNGYFLVYLYYDFENRGVLFKFLFSIVTLVRKVISKLPNKLKKISTDIIAIIIYYPFSLISRLVKFLSKSDLYLKLPLSYYSDKSFYVMRNDSFDRFGTPLEQRFNKTQINDMMTKCGLSEIVFSKKSPYWHAVGKKA